MNPQRTATFLMANLGSEVSQIFQYKNSNQIDMAKNSAERAYKIIDSFIIHQDAGEGRKEAEILRTIIKDAVSENPKLNVNEKELNSYFKPFAIRALS